MIMTGCAMLLFGLIVWMVNVDWGYDPTAFDPGYDESNPAGQLFGLSFTILGGTLLFLAWTAAAVCRQIVEAQQRDAAED